MRKDKPLFITKHQLKRMSQRGISKIILYTVLNNGEWKSGKNPLSFEVEYKGVIVVLYSQKTQYNLATCKLNRELTCEAEKIKQEKNISFWKALHYVVKSIDFSKEIKNIKEELYEVRQ